MIRILWPLLALGLAPSAASANATYPCQSGYVYKCQGGINGVQCWCEKRGLFTHTYTFGFDLGPGDRGLDIGFSASLTPASLCLISFSVEIDALGGGLLESFNGQLTAAAPSALFSRQYSVAGRRYLRVSGSGAAQNCSARELLSLEALRATFDPATGATGQSSVVHPIFATEDRTRLPPFVPAYSAPAGGVPSGETIDGR